MRTESAGQLLNLEVQAIYDGFAAALADSFGYLVNDLAGRKDGDACDLAAPLARFARGLRVARRCRDAALAAVRENQTRE